ncbi:hypothetical protein AVEN_142242-1 [Araneus ventricosus]|uniref:Tc1-like transposase DDE domain-containing protein n=1 Tax=Araneus ventricosus TaxID=182803 RepID=A0A4Y2FG72_ARAVE|nr:hypothetical protein AVEN_142242-1 [Araneus ventricosus]
MRFTLYTVSKFPYGANLPRTEVNTVSKFPYGSESSSYGSEYEDLPLSDLRNVWFQHDGAPPHKVSSAQHYILDTFQQQVIGYGGCVEWPPLSPDLKPLDFFLWVYIKQRVYATPPPTLQELSKPYYGCLCQRVTCHVVQCAAGSAVPCLDVYCC